MIKKREIEKFPYGTSQGLSEEEAKKNLKDFISFCKKYGPTTIRIGLFAIMMSSSASAIDGPPPGSPPSPTPGQLTPTPCRAPGLILALLPALKEFLGIAAVGLTCAAAAASPVRGMGIAAYALIIAAKAANKF